MRTPSCCCSAHLRLTSPTRKRSPIFPPRPWSFTERTQAQELVARAEQVQGDYSRLAVAEPGSVGHRRSTASTTSDCWSSFRPGANLHVRLPAAARSTSCRCWSESGQTIHSATVAASGRTRRGRCCACQASCTGVASFSAETTQRRSEPASGVYRFSSRTFRAASKVVRLTGQGEWNRRELIALAARDERHVDGVLRRHADLCQGGRLEWITPRTRKLDCRFPLLAAAGGFDVGRVRIQQVASLASSGSLWAGLATPTIVAAVPR